MSTSKDLRKALDEGIAEGVFDDPRAARHAIEEAIRNGAANQLLYSPLVNAGPPGRYAARYMALKTIMAVAVTPRGGMAP
jgi:putative exporter of polyketide antibiotics